MESVNAFWENVNQMRKEDSKGKVEGGRWVKITGLQSAAGQKLNGKVGQVLSEEPNKEDRYQILIDGQTKGLLVKSSNFIDVPMKDMVETYRIPCTGDKAQRANLLFPKTHSMFTECSPNGNCPALALCGVPFVVKKIESRTSLRERYHYDNQWATYMMIDPISGFAPPEWQSYVGSVLIYRPGGKHCGGDDVGVVNHFLNDILDKYPEGRSFDPMTWLNPRFFQKYARRCAARYHDYDGFTVHILDDESRE